MNALSLLLALLIGQPPTVHDADGAIISNGSWNLPATIEALRDVALEAAPLNGEQRQRGVLYVYRLNETAFQIHKGERFEMLRLYPESPSCRIGFKGKTYEVGTCSWIDGVKDHQAEFFRVISGHLDEVKSK